MLIDTTSNTKLASQPTKQFVAHKSPLFTWKSSNTNVFDRRPSSLPPIYLSRSAENATIQSSSRHPSRKRLCQPFLSISPEDRHGSYGLRHHHHYHAAVPCMWRHVPTTGSMAPPHAWLSSAAVVAPLSSTGLASQISAHAVASRSTNFFQLLFVFVLGGLFFSTAIAAVSACYAFGMDNIRYLWDALQAVLKAVWISFKAALSTAKATLLLSNEDEKKASWKWRQAWAVLKEQLAKTRQTAAEGVSALRQEATMYAGAVGVPGLIPIQYLLNRLLPFSIAGALEDSLRDSLLDIAKATRSINRITLASFDIGQKAPKLEAARAYELENKAIAFDYDVEWKSEMEVRLTVVTIGGLARIPVVVKNLNFDGVIRVILTPLVKEGPGYGALLISLPRSPTVGLDVRVAGGDVTRIPWLRSELISAIQKGIRDQLLWPKRLVIPTVYPLPNGRGQKQILSDAVLAALEKSDPLLEREQMLMSEQPILRDQRERSLPNFKSLKQQFKVFVNRDEKNDTGSDQDRDELADEVPSEFTLPHMQHSVKDKRRRSQIETGVLWNFIMKSLRSEKG